MTKKQGSWPAIRIPAICWTDGIGTGDHTKTPAGINLSSVKIDLARRRRRGNFFQNFVPRKVVIGRFSRRVLGSRIWKPQGADHSQAAAAPPDRACDVSIKPPAQLAQVTAW
jgi:hypothetical protein